MQKTFFFILAIAFSIYIIPQNAIAQNIQDWNLWGLPKGAKARFGEGSITGNITYSNDGKRLAVPSSVGIWVYDAETDKPLNLLTGDMNGVRNVAFSPAGRTLASACRGGPVLLWELPFATVE